MRITICAGGAQAGSKLTQLRRELVDPWFEPPPQPLAGAQQWTDIRIFMDHLYIGVEFPRIDGVTVPCL